MGPDLLYLRSKRMKSAGLLANHEYIPATLLLEERAALALNAVAGLVDPTSDRPFFIAGMASPQRLGLRLEPRAPRGCLHTRETNVWLFRIFRGGEGL